MQNCVPDPEFVNVTETPFLGYNLLVKNELARSAAARVTPQSKRTESAGLSAVIA